MDAVIVAGARTPFVKAGGALEPYGAVELGRIALRECLYRAEIDLNEIDEVIAGNIAGPPEAANVARVIALEAGVPARVPAHTVGRNCASGMEAVVEAARLIRTGEAHTVAALGVESMSRVPILYPDSFRRLLMRLQGARTPLGKLGAWTSLRPADLKPVVALILGLTDPVTGLNMGETAEVLAREFAIPREAQDRFAKRSQDRVVAARARGVYAEEIVAVYPRSAAAVVAEDIGPRPDTTVEKLARLKPIFDRRHGTVTAGNSSMLTDGAAAVLLMSAERAKALGCKPWVKLRAQAVVGCDPRRMGLGPAYAIPRALAKAGLKLQDVDLIEINEAFAVQVLACLQALASKKFALAELGMADAVGEIADERLNVNGGAIALGHPVGASGTRLILTLAKEMARRGAAIGLASLCIGGGQGQAVVLERAS